jgi:hypothetical protein
MHADRRFNEKEIAAIFEDAAKAQSVAHDHPSANVGLTLAELKEIGAESGISAELVSRAAASIDQVPRLEQQHTFLGLPAGASHVADVPGTFTDQDWDRLVVDLRQTFQARGEISRDGSLREWKNGNLYALIEPYESGARLRFGTKKDEAKYFIPGGIGWFVWWVSIVLAKMANQGFEVDPSVIFLIVVALAGLGLAGLTASRLPAWSRKRQRQMEEIAGRVLRGRSVEAAPVPVQDLAGSHVDLTKEALLDIPEDLEERDESESRRDRIRN